MGACNSKAGVLPASYPSYCLPNPVLTAEHIQIIRTSWKSIVGDRTATGATGDQTSSETQAGGSVVTLAVADKDISSPAAEGSVVGLAPTPSAGEQEATKTAASGATATAAANETSIVKFYDLFYTHLFEVAPEVRPMFKQSIKVQGRALVRLISAAVTILEQDALVPTLKSLAMRHGTYGVRAAHYGIVGQVLVWTLQQCLGEQWTDEVATAWVTVYSVMMTVILPVAEECDKKADRATKGCCA